MKCAEGVVRSTDFSLENLGATFDDEERGTEPAVFSQWLYGLTRGSIGTLSMEQLSQYRNTLRAVFDAITYERDGGKYFSSKYGRPETEANIRKAFCGKRIYETRTECIPEAASLLNIANFKPVIYTASDKIEDYYPERDLVEKIILTDQGKLKPDKRTLHKL